MLKRANHWTFNNKSLTLLTLDYMLWILWNQLLLFLSLLSSFFFSFSRSTQKVEKNVHLVHQKNETMSTLIKCLVLNIDNDQSMTKAQRNVNYFYFFSSIPSNHSSLGFIFIDLIASVAKFVVKFNVRLYQIISIGYRKLPFYVWKVEAKKKRKIRNL